MGFLLQILNILKLKIKFVLLSKWISWPALTLICMSINKAYFRSKFGWHLAQLSNDNEKKYMLRNFFFVSLLTPDNFLRVLKNLDTNCWWCLKMCMLNGILSPSNISLWKMHYMLDPIFPLEMTHLKNHLFYQFRNITCDTASRVFNI